MILDLYGSSIIVYKTGNLVLDTIHLAKKTSRCGVAVPQQPGIKVYFNLIQEYGITYSGSRQGNCYDSAMAENFFFP